MVAKEVLEARVAEITRLLGVHAGGVELVRVSEEGVARVRFTGMCQGCPNRPLTSAWAVKPGLLELEGITGVEIEGARISAEAEARMMHYIGPYMPSGPGGPRPPAWGELPRADASPASEDADAG